MEYCTFRIQINCIEINMGVFAACDLLVVIACTQLCPLNVAIS